MGSWNETCMVTQLPITPGDLVKVCFIRENPFNISKYNGGVYHTDLWEPIGGPIKCEYDDCGRYSPVLEEVFFAQFIAEAISEYVVERDWGKNTCHDVPTWKKDLLGSEAFDNLCEIICEDRLLVQERILGEDKQSGVAMVAIHEKIFDKVISNEFTESIADSWYDFSSYEENHDKYCKYLDSLISSDESERILIKYNERALRGILAPNWDLAYLKKSLNKDNEKLLYSYIQHFAELDMFNSRLGFIRKQWGPQCGHGSQTTAYKASQFVMQQAIDLAEKKHEELYQDEDE